MVSAIMSTTVWVLVSLVVVHGMDNESTVRAYCYAGPSSLWETYVCTKLRLGLQPQCWPQRHRAPARCSTRRGIVAFFHGYSACPDAYNEMALVLQDECLDVYSFTSPGHGLNLTEATTSSASWDIVGRYNLSGLPTRRADYVSFAMDATSIIEEEIAREFAGSPPQVVATVGLSLGAPIATVAATHSSVFSHVLLFSPFYGITAPTPPDPSFASAADQQVARVDECLRSPALTVSFCLCNDFLPGFFGTVSFSNSSAALCDLVSSRISQFAPDVTMSFQLLQLLVQEAFEWAVETTDLSEADQTALDSVIGWFANPRLPTVACNPSSLPRPKPRNPAYLRVRLTTSPLIGASCSQGRQVRHRYRQLPPRRLLRVSRASLARRAQPRSVRSPGKLQGTTANDGVLARPARRSNSPGRAPTAFACRTSSRRSSCRQSSETARRGTASRSRYCAHSTARAHTLRRACGS